ncbi:MAG: DUF2284 domain-containing protein [Oscillospiraceae bacterium]|jgi:predicted metal-binding protein|nr:DUF2284 domain-containing protein [Oscillospiraceae bacterium]
MPDYLNTAKSLGFSQVKIIRNISIECKPELRAYCNPQGCPNHGQNWVCPPGCGTLEECREKVQGFENGILLQSITELNPPTAPEAYKALNRAHNFRFKAFIEAVKPDALKILPLTSGGCVFCEQCSYPVPCVKPDVKMESLSAFGIDVGKLCEQAGLAYSFSNDIVYFTALLLWKQFV